MKHKIPEDLLCIREVGKGKFFITIGLYQFFKNSSNELISCTLPDGCETEYLYTIIGPKEMVDWNQS